VEDLFVSGPLQEAALELVAAPAWRAHLRRLRRVLRERRDAIVAALGEQGFAVPLVPEGGMNLWVRLDEDDRELARRAAAAGVLVSPGREFFAAEPPARFLRLTYGAEPPERLVEGVRRLGELKRGQAPFRNEARA
jgi:DNA-binding transcriptional MocR family regulator